MICRPEGPIPAKIMLVGEAPGFDEERTGRPFQGTSGQELNRMLAEAGITRSECFTTNVARERPANNDLNLFIAKAKKDVTPKHQEYRGRYCLPPVIEGVHLLAKEIKMVQPNVIVALGNTALWALTGLSGIQRWRGSMLHTNGDMGMVKLIATIHPAAILREWSWRNVAVHDLRRAAKFRSGEDYPLPEWRFRIKPNFTQVLQTFGEISQLLSKGKTKLSFDIETAFGHIDCCGIAWSLQDSICIPFAGNYWSADQEEEIVWWLWKLLCHENAEVVGQNLLYDCQYVYRHWGFIPRVTQDTMISWHVAFAGLPKKLDFQASILCRFYKQWKPDRSKQKEGG